MAKPAQRVGNPDVATPAISSAILKVAPLTCAIGAKITNVNLGAASRDPALMQEIRALLLRHKARIRLRRMAARRSPDQTNSMQPLRISG